jgi:hypothetical protein
MPSVLISPPALLEVVEMVIFWHLPNLGDSSKIPKIPKIGQNQENPQNRGFLPKKGVFRGFSRIENTPF